MRIRSMIAMLLLAGSVLVLGGCSAGGDAKVDTAALQANEWSLVGTSVSSADIAKVGITLKFDETQYSGFSGVNQYSGTYTAKADGGIEFGPAAGTLMAGPDPLMKVESAYLKLIEGCDSYRLENGTLTLMTGETDTLIFEVAKAAALPGSSWLVTGYNNGKEAVVGPAVDSTLTIEFGTDGTVAGSGGVNRFNGGFESTDTTVKIGPLAATMMAGEPELMAQETAFLKALENATTWSISRGILDMRDASGAMQITAIAAETSATAK